MRDENTCSAITCVKNRVPVHPEPFENLTLNNFYNVATDFRTAILYVCSTGNHAHENANL